MNHFRFLALSLSIVAMTLTSHAQSASNAIVANVGIYSQYIFRGLTQTNGTPALQGGFDWAHSSGAYLGLWGSSITWLKENTSTTTTVSGSYDTEGTLELDVYGGYKFGAGNFTYDVGVLQYYYPGTVKGTNIKSDTQEAYFTVAWKWLSLKYSGVINSNVFGVKKASGTYYLDLNANYSLGDSGVTLGAHYGMQKYAGTDDRLTAGQTNDNTYSYSDTKVSVSYDMSNLSNSTKSMTIGLAATSTSGATCGGYGKVGTSCTINNVNASGTYPKNIADSQTALWISKSF